MEIIEEVQTESSEFVQESQTMLPDTGRKRGRPRKDGAPPGSSAAPASSTTNKPRPVPRPKFSLYSNESPRVDDRSQAGWNWIAALSPMDKSRCLGYLYREWPVLLDPPKGDFKYIDKIMAADMPTSDEELARRYGCGDYKLTFVQTVPDNQELCQIRIANCGARNLRDFPPVDRRLGDVSQVDLENKSNKSYIEYLRGRGLMPDQIAGIKKEAEMAETSLVNGVLEQNRELVREVMNNNRAQAPAEANAGEVKSLEIVDRAVQMSQEITQSTYTRMLDVATAKGTGSDPVASAIEIAKLLVGATSPQSAEVEKLRLQLDEERRRREEDQRAREREDHRRDMDSLRTEIVALRTNPNVSVPTTGVDSIVETITKKVLEDLDIDDLKPAAKAAPWWVEPLLEKGLPVIGGLVQHFMGGGQAQPQAAQQAHTGVPPPPPGYQVGQPVTQIPAAPQQQPQQNEVARRAAQLLADSSAQFIQTLTDTEMDGDDFADFLIESHGKLGYALIANWSEEEIAQAFRTFPMTAAHVATVTPERLASFSRAFKGYNQDAYDKKMDAREKAEKGGAA